MLTPYDYLAMAIQGREKCGASAFDGQKIVLATNKTGTHEHHPQLMDAAKSYLSFVAKAAIEAKTHPDMKQKKEEILTKLRALVDLGTQEFSATTPDRRLQDLYRHNSTKALNHVTDDIFAGALGQAGGFSEKAVKAMANNQFTLAQDQGLDGGDLHAELKIAQHLIDHRRSGQHTIGTSKKLCNPCGAVFEAVKTSNVPCEFTEVQVHEGYYRSAYPRFLVDYPQIGNAVLTSLDDKHNQHLRGESLKAALNHVFHPDKIIECHEQHHDLDKITPKPFAALEIYQSKVRTQEQQATAAPANTPITRPRSYADAARPYATASPPISAQSQPTQGQALQDMDAILKSAAQADAKAQGHDMGGPAKK